MIIRPILYVPGIHDTIGQIIICPFVYVRPSFGPRISGVLLLFCKNKKLRKRPKIKVENYSEKLHFESMKNKEKRESKGVFTRGKIHHF